jgi:hypothetical protein
MTAASTKHQALHETQDPTNHCNSRRKKDLPPKPPPDNSAQLAPKRPEPCTKAHRTRIHIPFARRKASQSAGQTVTYGRRPATWGSLLLSSTPSIRSDRAIARYRSISMKGDWESDGRTAKAANGRAINKDLATLSAFAARTIRQAWLEGLTGRLLPNTSRSAFLGRQMAGLADLHDALTCFVTRNCASPDSNRDTFRYRNLNGVRSGVRRLQRRLRHREAGSARNDCSLAHPMFRRVVA